MTVDTVQQLQICVLYIDRVSQKIQKPCQKYGIKTASRNQRKNNCNFDKLKDKDKIGLRSHVVYEIPCKDCDNVYIGQTNQYLKNHMYQHKVNIKKPVTQHTSLTNHKTNFSHQFDYDKVKVITTEKNYRQRLMKEMINILKNKNLVNKISDVKN